MIKRYNKKLLKKTSLKVRAGEVINFEFSEQPLKVRAYIWGDEIKELDMKRGTIKVPQLDKKIVVGVEGQYKNGSILYAVVLDIRGERNIKFVILRRLNRIL